MSVKKIFESLFTYFFIYRFTVCLYDNDIGIPIIATIFPGNTNDIFDIQFNEFTENHILLLNII